MTFAVGAAFVLLALGWFGRPTHLVRIYDRRAHLIYVDIAQDVASAIEDLRAHTSWGALIDSHDVTTARSWLTATFARALAVRVEHPRFNVSKRTRHR